MDKNFANLRFNTESVWEIRTNQSIWPGVWVYLWGEHCEEIRKGIDRKGEDKKEKVERKEVEGKEVERENTIRKGSERNLKDHES